MRLPAVTLGEGAPQSRRTRLRRSGIVLGVLALGVAVGTGAWWVGVFGLCCMAAALVVPSRATMRAVREAEATKALPEET